MSRALRVRAAAGAVVAAVVLAACSGGSPTAAPSATPSSGSDGVSVLTSLPTPAGTYDASADPIVRVVKAVTPSVVTVTTRTQSVPSFFGQSAAQKGVGTGFVVRSDGFILTNEHVVEGADSITVTLPSGRELAARVVATDHDHDLALLKVDATGLRPLALGDSSTLVVGERVVAIGYALDLSGGPTVTSGVISSVQRTIEVQDPNGGPGGSVRTYKDVIQTDAALNPGNSGGPLVTLDGRVVGIDVAGSTNAENIGFAVAVNAAKALLSQALNV